MSMVDKLAYVKRREGLTSEEIARRSGVPLGTVNKIFSGQTRSPSPLALDQICQVLGIPMRYLLYDSIPVDACIGVYGELDGLQLISERQSDMLLRYRMLTEHGRNTVDAVMELLLSQGPQALPAGAYRALICYQSIAQGRRGPFGDGFRYRALQALEDQTVEEADFAMLLSDHVMDPVYPPGTILAVKKQPAVHNQLGVFVVNREVFVRKLHEHRSRRKLVAVNLEYKDIHLSERDEYRCLGTILGAVRNYYWM